ncbi:hypothetical protein KP509_1Z319600 [Ceratopteris richardii]|nr:hypothetical protein KP509_1Z319600 [Ceratopteris richardii]
MLLWLFPILKNLLSGRIRGVAYWRTSICAFGDIYDVEHFQSSLKNEVHIVHQLPPEFEWSTPQYYESKCLERPNCFLYIPKHSKKEWYFENVLPALERYLFIYPYELLFLFFWIINTMKYIIRVLC